MIRIIPVTTKAQTRQFLDVPYTLYKDDPMWRPPLKLERADHINPRKNPSMEFLDYQMFLAIEEDVADKGNGQTEILHKDILHENIGSTDSMTGMSVQDDIARGVSSDGAAIIGRIAVCINRLHQQTYDDGAAHFGFFDCVPRETVALSLLSAAKHWAKSKYARKLIGPAQWSVKDECGMLVDGFDTPSVVMMGHGRPDYPQYLETAGFEKAVDMIAFQNDLYAGYPRPRMTQRMVALADADPDISIRSLHRADLVADVTLAMDIFNDAWSENWGFLPYTPAEVKHMAEAMKPLLFQDGFLFGYIDGQAAAFICMIPDLNEATRDIGGNLWPFGWVKLLWRLKGKRIKQSRIPLMGLRKEWHNTRQGLAVVAKLCETVFQNGRESQGFTHCELSWVLESNTSMIRIAEQASSKAYKTYRMYEHTL